MLFWHIRRLAGRAAEGPSRPDDLERQKVRFVIVRAMKRPASVLGPIGAGIAALAPLLASAAETPAEPYGWGPQMMWGWGWSGMIFGPLFMILGLAVTVALVVLLVRWLGGPWPGAAPPHYGPSGRTPLDILKERFARGEIDKDEFAERRRMLGE
jgi:putative membrane protein